MPLFPRIEYDRSETCEALCWYLPLGVKCKEDSTHNTTGSHNCTASGMSRKQIAEIACGPQLRLIRLKHQRVQLRKAFCKVRRWWTLTSSKVHERGEIPEQYRICPCTLRAIHPLNYCSSLHRAKAKIFLIQSRIYPNASITDTCPICPPSTSRS